MTSFGAYGTGNRRRGDVSREIIYGSREERETSRTYRLRPKRLTDRGVFVRRPGSAWEGAWLPLSQIDVDGATLVVGKAADIIVPGWLAIAKGLAEA